MNKSNFFLQAVLSAAGIMSYSLVALADEVTCRDTLGAITVDNVRVPSGATYILSGTRVKGNVKVESNAILRASKVNVIGNIQGEIDGNLQCKENRPAPTGGSNIVKGNKEDQCSRL